MSFNFIHDFKLQIHQLLTNDPDIIGGISGIYLSVVQDAKYPFLLINVLKVED